MNFKIRRAAKEDCKDISRMIMELAVYEKMPDQVKISHEALTSVQEVRFEVMRKRMFYPDAGRVVSFLNVFTSLVKGTPSLMKKAMELERDGFCQNPFFECLVAEVPQERKSNGGFTIIGYALYFYTYSTWKGRAVYVEDLYVMPEFRGNGIGTALLGKVAEIGKKKQCVRLQLSVLNWNTPSRDFYAAKGAQDLTVTEGWHAIRFDGQNLDNLANEAPKD